MNEILKDLNITQEELDNYINSLTVDKPVISYELKEFNELYNGVQIDNPSNGKYYYTLNIEGKIYLQNIVPYINGNNPINEDNYNDIINEHKNKLIEEYILSTKYNLAIEYFSNINN